MIKFNCSKCSKKLNAPAEYAGHNIKCPACATVLVVPQPDTGDMPAEPTGDLHNLVSGLESGEAVEQEQPVIKVVKPESEDMSPTPKTPSAIAGATAAASKFVRSVVLSIIFAAAGALVWALISKSSGYEIGWIAWGIGLAAGMGALIGGAQPSVKLGVTAAVIAVCAIMSGKLLALNWIYDEYNNGSYYANMTDAEISELLQDPEEYNGVVKVWHMIDSGLLDKLDAGEIDETEMESEIAKIVEDKAQEVSSWTQAQKISAARTVYSGITFEPEPGEKIAALKEGFIQSFGGADLIFIVLAVVTAFKTSIGMRR